MLLYCDRLPGPRCDDGRSMGADAAVEYAWGSVPTSWRCYLVVEEILSALDSGAPLRNVLVVGDVGALALLLSNMQWSCFCLIMKKS